jgi:hypothetical protein
MKPTPTPATETNDENHATIGGRSTSVGSRFCDTPETNSPDDVAMWLEIGLPRQMELERNEARAQAQHWRDLALGVFAKDAPLPWEINSENVKGDSR